MAPLHLWYLLWLYFAPIEALWYGQLTFYTLGCRLGVVMSVQGSMV